MPSARSVRIVVQVQNRDEVRVTGLSFVLDGTDDLDDLDLLALFTAGEKRSYHPACTGIGCRRALSVVSLACWDCRRFGRYLGGLTVGRHERWLRSWFCSNWRWPIVWVFGAYALGLTSAVAGVGPVVMGLRPAWLAYAAAFLYFGSIVTGTFAVLVLGILLMRSKRILRPL